MRLNDWMISAIYEWMNGNESSFDFFVGCREKVKRPDDEVARLRSQLSLDLGIPSILGVIGKTCMVAWDSKTTYLPTVLLYRSVWGVASWGLCRRRWWCPRIPRFDKWVWWCDRIRWRSNYVIIWVLVSGAIAPWINPQTHQDSDDDVEMVQTRFCLGVGSDPCKAYACFHDAETVEFTRWVCVVFKNVGTIHVLSHSLVLSLQQRVWIGFPRWRRGITNLR